MAIRTIIADDHQLVLRSLRTALESDGGFEVVGETDSGAHVAPLVSRLNPELVLLDLHMPGMDGLTCLDLLRKRHPDIKVVMVSASDEEVDIQSALRRGAVGYILKSINPDELPIALRHAISGTSFHAVGGGDTPEQHISRTVGLTDRELTILKALTRGLSNKEISQENWVTEQTVKFHLSNIYRKLDVSNRAEAVRYAMQNGIAGEARDKR